MRSRALRARFGQCAVPVNAPEGAIDTCGTGGDAKGTHNISTCAAFVVAGAGVPVAKHGNRSISSRSGSADVLAALGVNIECAPETVARCIETMRARLHVRAGPPSHHTPRDEGKARARRSARSSICSVLSPILPAPNIRWSAYSPSNGSSRSPACSVCLGSSAPGSCMAADGLDELTTTGISHVAVLDRGRVSTFKISPRNAGLPEARPEDLTGGDAIENAAHIRAVLQGNRGPLRDIVLLNAAAALLVVGKANSLREAVALGRRGDRQRQGQGRSRCSGRAEPC